MSKIKVIMGLFTVGALAQLSFGIINNGMVEVNKELPTQGTESNTQNTSGLAPLPTHKLLLGFNANSIILVDDINETQDLELASMFLGISAGYESFFTRKTGLGLEASYKPLFTTAIVINGSWSDQVGKDKSFSDSFLTHVLSYHAAFIYRPWELLSFEPGIGMSSFFIHGNTVEVTGDAGDHMVRVGSNRHYLKGQIRASLRLGEKYMLTMTMASGRSIGEWKGQTMPMSGAFGFTRSFNLGG